MSARTGWILLMCSIPRNVHASVFPNRQMRSPDIANGHRTAANAVDRQRRGKSRPAIVRANVIEIALSRVALKINHVDDARVVNRYLRLDACIGHAHERYLASLIEFCRWANRKRKQR